MSQDDTPTLPPAGGEGGARGGGAARPAAPSHATEPTHAGHPRRRPVGRRARCADVVAATAAARANEQAELYNVDRVSKSEGLDGLPADYSKLPPAVPELGPPLPGDLGPAIVRSKQPVTAAYAAPADERRAAQRGRSGRGLVGVLPLGCAEGRAGGAVAGRRRSGPRRQCGVRPAGGWAGLDGGPACRPDRRTEPARPERAFLKGGSTETVIPAT